MIDELIADFRQLWMSGVGGGEAWEFLPDDEAEAVSPVIESGTGEAVGEAHGVEAH